MENTNALFKLLTIKKMRLLYLILSILLILILSSCIKNGNNNLTSNNYKISVVGNNKKSTYTYDLNGNILSCSNTYRDNGIVLYKYKDDLPIEKKYSPDQNGAYYYTITYNYNKADKSLSYFKEDDISTYQKTYILNNDHSVSYIINDNSDTISSYNYSNGILNTIVHYNAVDSFFYDTNSNLIEVKSINQNTGITTILFDYNNKNKWVKQTGSYHLEYTYSSNDKLTTVTINNATFTIIQNNCFNPINMNPINFFLYPYLELELID